MNLFSMHLRNTLNLFKVTSQLRGDSEMDYLRLFGAEWRNSGGHQDWEQNKPNQHFLSNHPRYMDLIKGNTNI